MKKLYWIAVLVGAGLVLTPMAMYVHTFGSELSHSHSRWAEMGTAMGGIYAPMLAIATAFILAMQFNLQRRQQLYIEKQHKIDKAYHDTTIALKIITAELESSGLRQALESIPNLADLPPEEREIKMGFHKASMECWATRHFRLVPNWNRVYFNIAGLESEPLEHLKLCMLTASSLSIEMATALDRMHYLFSVQLPFQYEFAPELIPKQGGK